MKKIYSVFTGTGSYVPTKQIKNDFFHSNEFYDSTGKKLDTPNEEITRKFEEITTIAERRYAEDDQVTSDLALIASNKAIETAGIDKEELEYIILENNVAEARVNDMQIEVVTTMAARLKQKLGIRDPAAIAYDVLFGCPGWVQAVIQEDYHIKSGEAKKILVVGADVRSRISDPHDRD